ncbi:hypothetical protein [Solimonas soli]|uniref:hypothetical protein n=1 Tax=Solimonas soli TaxID=413479 RepID=UPI0004B4326A|nr:hypothetical protein [Solimonas soli]
MQFAEHAVKGLGRKLAIAAMAATFGLGIVACGDDTKNTENNGGTVTPVTAPKGTVVGQIVDTNGNPINGATVYIADGAIGSAAAKAAAIKSGAIKPKASVSTNAAGQFTITNVVVQSVANSGGSSTGSEYNQPIQIFVDTPSGYLDATIAVYPQAQVVNDQPGGGTVSGGQTNAPLVFIDGFTASTGTVKIPALTSKVVGTLRDSTTGAAVAGQTLTLDFLGRDVSQFPNSTVAPVTYATSILTAVTQDDGSFTFTNVPDDSNLILGSELYFVEGFDDDHKYGPVSTATEGANTTVLGLIYTSPVATNDSIAPFVQKVDEVVANGGVGELASSFTDTFTIHFSEKLSAASTAVIKVTVANPGGTETIVSATPTLDLATNTLTIKTASPIAANKTIKIYISKENIEDVAGNALVVATPANDKVLFDSDSTDNRDLILTLKTYNPPVTGLQPVTPARILTATNTASQYYLSSDALTDTIENAGGADFPIEQLNAPESRLYLARLLDALEDGHLYSGPFHFSDVHTDVARVKFTTNGASGYAFVLANDDGTFAAPSVTVITPTVNVPSSGGVSLDEPLGDGTYPALYPVTAGKTGQDIEIAIGNVEPGQTLKIVSLGDTGSAPVVSESAVGTLPLLDKIAPTVVPQLWQLAAAEAAASQGEGGANGAGGNLVLGGENAKPGTVIYPVTPQLYDVDDTINDGYAGDELNGSHELKGLSSADLKSSFPAGTQYDATGAAAFLSSVHGTIAINVSEGLASTQPLLKTDAAATTVFSNPGQQGVDSQGNPVGISTEFGPGLSFFVYKVDIDSAEKLQADARKKLSLDLTGVTDLAGNAASAATKAKVQLRDFTPPVMTRAFFDGTYWVFQFNEPVKLNVGQITLEDSGDVIDLALAAASAVPADKRASYFVDGSGNTVDSIIVIPVGNPETAGIAAATALGGTAYGETSYATAAALRVGGKSLTALAESNLAVKPKHGLVSYKTVQDKADNSDIGGLTGNSWDSWEANGLGVHAPEFYAANILGPFTESLVSSTVFTSGRVLAAGNTTFSVDLQFTHPLDLTAADTDVNGKLSGAEVTAYVASHLVLAVDNTGVPDANITVSSADVGSFIGGTFTPATVSGDAASRTLKQGSVLRVTFSGAAGQTIEATNRINVATGQSFASAVDPNLLIGPDDRDAALREITSAAPTTTTEFAPIAPNDAGTGVEKAFQ